MPCSDGRCASENGDEDGMTPDPGHERLRLLRGSHIFTSAIREILDVRLLREVSPSPLTSSQFQILKLMSLNGDHQIGDVAGFLGVSAPAATKNIDKLERLGLVTRCPSEGDRRATLLSVSRKGRRLVRRYDELRATRLAPAMDAFQPAEIEQLTRLIERFSVSLLTLEPSSNRLCLRCAGYIEDDCPMREVHGGCRYQKVRNSRRTGEDDGKRAVRRRLRRARRAPAARSEHETDGRLRVTGSSDGSIR